MFAELTTWPEAFQTVCVCVCMCLFLAVFVWRITQ